MRVVRASMCVLQVRVQFGLAKQRKGEVLEQVAQNMKSHPMRFTKTQIRVVLDANMTSGSLHPSEATIRGWIKEASRWDGGLDAYVSHLLGNASLAIGQHATVASTHQQWPCFVVRLETNQNEYGWGCYIVETGEQHRFLESDLCVERGFGAQEVSGHTQRNKVLVREAKAIRLLDGWKADERGPKVAVLVDPRYGNPWAAPALEPEELKKGCEDIEFLVRLQRDYCQSRSDRPARWQGSAGLRRRLEQRGFPLSATVGCEVPLHCWTALDDEDSIQRLLSQVDPAVAAKQNSKYVGQQAIDALASQLRKIVEGVKRFQDAHGSRLLVYGRTHALNWNDNNLNLGKQREAKAGFAFIWPLIVFVEGDCPKIVRVAKTSNICAPGARWNVQRLVKALENPGAGTFLREDSATDVKAAGLLMNIASKQVPNCAGSSSSPLVRVSAAAGVSTGNDAKGQKSRSDTQSNAGGATTLGSGLQHAQSTGGAATTARGQRQAATEAMTKMRASDTVGKLQDKQDQAEDLAAGRESGADMCELACDTPRHVQEPDGSSSEDDQESEIPPYEALRLANMARNQIVLRTLGLGGP